MNEVYKAVFAILKNALNIEIYDHIPQDIEVYPVVRVDPIQSSNFDVDDKSGFTGTIQIISYSQYRGSKEVSELATQIYNALHRKKITSANGYGISGITENYRRITTGADGITRHSVQQFNIIFEKL